MHSKKKTGLQSALVQLDSEVAECKKNRKGLRDKQKQQTRIQMFEAHVKLQKGKIAKFKNK